MKTNPRARRVLKIQAIAFGVAILAMIGVSFRIGETVAVRAGQAVASRIECPQPPALSLADAMGMVAAR